MMGAILVALSACGEADDGRSAHQELVVSAASSLTESFREIEVEFERAHPEVDVILNLGGSSLLREQITSGAPVAVFASASLDIMDQVSTAGYLAGSYRVFARNRMAIAVPVGNPAGVNGLEDLADRRLLLGLCTDTVPCGIFARQVLATAGIQAFPDTTEPNVRALLTKVEAGELDVAIVYATDIAASDDVDGLPIDERVNVVVDYPIGVIGSAPEQGAAQVFVEFVLSEDGRRIVRAYGFSLP